MQAAKINQTQQPTAQHRRLKGAVKRLVIELGYLEQTLTEDGPNSSLSGATKDLDSAIDKLNQHLDQGASK